MEGNDRGPWIQTYSGRAFYLLTPRAEDVALVDIAHALSNICRYTGHCKEFYSVAQHCVHVSEACDPNHAMDGLLHDASEAYVADISSPLKSLLREYKEIETRSHIAIALRYGTNFHIPECVHDADRAVLLSEKKYLLNESIVPWEITGDEVPGLVIEPWSPANAETAFLDRFWSLKNGKA